MVNLLRLDVVSLIGFCNIDLIVDFNEVDVEDYADNYFEFKFSLQNILNRPIDLLEAQAIKNPYFKKVLDQTKELVYG